MNMVLLSVDYNGVVFLAFLLSWPFRPPCITAFYPGRRSLNIRPAAYLFISLALGWYKLAFQAGNA